MQDITLFLAEKLISLQTDSTSKGNQLKWYSLEEQLYVKGQFWYQEKFWRDDLVERIASIIGMQLPLQGKNVSVLEQKLCDIQLEDGTTIHGVYSNNFCRPEEKFIPFYRLLQLNDIEFPYNASIEEKWNFILENMEYITGLDLTDYLIVMTIIDFLVGNEDRHLSNFGIIYGNDSFRIAPLFDFGLGLFEHDRKYEGLSFRDCLKKMIFKPFHKEGERVISFLSDRYNLNSYLKEKINLSECQLPSIKSSSYLLNRSKILGIELEGVR